MTHKGLCVVKNQTNKQTSLTESFVQQNNIPEKLDQVLTRFHKLDKAKLPSNGRLNHRFL